LIECRLSLPIKNLRKGYSPFKTPDLWSTRSCYIAETNASSWFIRRAIKVEKKGFTPRGEINATRVDRVKQTTTNLYWNDIVVETATMFWKENSGPITVCSWWFNSCTLYAHYCGATRDVLLCELVTARSRVTQGRNLSSNFSEVVMFWKKKKRLKKYILHVYIYIVLRMCGTIIIGTHTIPISFKVGTRVKT